MSLPKLAYNYNQKFLVFDFETECLSLTNNKAFELAWVLAQGNKILKSYEAKILHEDLKMSEGAARITRFDWHQYKAAAIDEEEAFLEFETLLWDPEIVIAGHNIISFDLPVYRLQALRRGKWSGWGDLLERSLDTLCLSRIYNEDRKPEKDLLCSQLKQIGRPPRGSKKATLSAMAKAFSLEVDENQLHGALYDINLNFKILNELIYKLEI